MKTYDLKKESDIKAFVIDARTMSREEILSHGKKLSVLLVMAWSDHTRGDKALAKDDEERLYKLFPEAVLLGDLARQAMKDKSINEQPKVDELMQQWHVMQPPEKVLAWVKATDGYGIQDLSPVKKLHSMWAKDILDVFDVGLDREHV